MNEREAHEAALAAWRSLTQADQSAIMAARLAARGERTRDPGASDLRIAMLADLCPSGSGPCGCGGGPPRSCGDPDRPGEVTREDCLSCQAKRWWAEGVEAGW